MDRAIQIQEFVNGIEASVALVSQEKGQLLVTICNDHFFRMIGGRRPGHGNFPIPLDSMVPNYTRHAFRENPRMLQDLHRPGS